MADTLYYGHSRCSLACSSLFRIGYSTFTYAPAALSTGSSALLQRDSRSQQRKPGPSLLYLQGFLSYYGLSAARIPFSHFIRRTS
jgi:hypothetical protein